MCRYFHLGWSLIIVLLFAVPIWAEGGNDVRFEQTRFDNMYELYEYNQEHGRSTLVTTDSVLHTAHILFDYTLRAAELKKFDANLRELTQAMMSLMVVHARDEAAKRYVMTPPPFGYDRVAAYFGVAQKLLNPDAEIPDLIRPTVEKEVALILAHQGRQMSPVMGVTEDYSQYVPRGHYTRNAQFQRFFLAMMWYGRAGFPISGEKAPGVKLTRDEARQNAWAGIELARNLDDSPLYRMPNSPTFLGLWKSIYQPTQFLVGDSDDLTPPEYAALSRKIFGEDLPGGWTADVQAKTDTFITEAIKMRSPRLFGSVQTDKEKTPPVSLRLFGQRFTPDGDIFQRLVHPQVDRRFMPSGLDIMAALGSQRALQWQRERGEVAKYPAYLTQLTALQQEMNAADRDWTKTAYLLWMKTLKDMIPSPMEVNVTGAAGAAVQLQVYPSWWNSERWQDKQLNAALGSWAELRHDTILYVKQTYTAALMAIMPKPDEPTIYVEPKPAVYRDLYQLMSTMQKELKAQGVFPEEMAPNYQQFLNLLSGLAVKSELELHPGLKIKLAPEAMEGEKLIPRIGEALREIETLPDPLREALTGKEDTRMALIADVHTDPNTQQVLEVGVGRVLAVVAPSKDGVDLYGPVFSYYEFGQPMDQRLTDGAWQRMLDQNKAGSPFILGRYLPGR